VIQVVRGFGEKDSVVRWLKDAESAMASETRREAIVKAACRISHYLTRWRPYRLESAIGLALVEIRRSGSSREHHDPEKIVRLVHVKWVKSGT